MRRPGKITFGPRGRAGFTLIEVVLALTIVASITVIVWGSISVSFESRQFMMNSFDQHQQVRLAVDRMSREFSMAFVAAHANKKDHIPSEAELDGATLEELQARGLLPTLGEEGEPPLALEGEEEGEGREERQTVVIETAFVGKSSEVHFTAMAHTRTQRNERASDQCEVAYIVRTARRRSADGRLRRELVRREDSTLDDDVEDGGVIYTLIDDVEDVEFEYWEEGGEDDEQGGGKWVKSWDSRSFGNRGKLPGRVKITIEVPVESSKGKRTRTFVTQAPIMMTRILDF